MSVTAPNEEFLTKRFLIPKMYEIMNPLLAWTDIFPQVRATAPVVAYKQEITSDSGDTKKERPKLMTTSGQWTYVEISQFTMKAANLNKRGFAIKIDQDALDYVEGVDEIQRALRKTGFWIAEDYNTRISTEIANSGTALAGDWTPAAEWSDANAAPISDLEDLEDAFIREGYPYRLTDVFVHKDNFKELKNTLHPLISTSTNRRSSTVLRTTETATFWKFQSWELQFTGFSREFRKGLLLQLTAITQALQFSTTRAPDILR